MSCPSYPYVELYNMIHFVDPCYLSIRTVLDDESWLSVLLFSHISYCETPAVFVLLSE